MIDNIFVIYFDYSRISEVRMAVSAVVEMEILLSLHLSKLFHGADP